MKEVSRRLIAAACCLLAAGTLIFPLELGATLTPLPWYSPPAPGAIPKPSPAPADPNGQAEDASAASQDEEANDSPTSDLARDKLAPGFLK